MPSPRHPFHAGRLAIGAIALLALAACGGSAGEAAAAAALGATGVEDVEIDEDDDSVSYRTDQGEVTITDGQAPTLPENFPGDVYLPGEYVVESTLSMDQDLFVALAVNEDVPTVYATAREAMAGHGWTETMAALENNENGLLTFEKDDRSAVLSVAREADGTSMGLQLTRIAQ